MVDDHKLPTIRLSKDPGDEYLIALAEAARVEALVTGNSHLVRLRAGSTLTPQT